MPNNNFFKKTPPIKNVSNLDTFYFSFVLLDFLSCENFGKSLRKKEFTDDKSTKRNA